MRHMLSIFLIVVGLGGVALSSGVSTALAAGPHAALLEIDGRIDRSTAQYLSRGIDKATEDGAQFIIVTLDTPGGWFSRTKQMVETIRSAKIPVVVYVSPPGARALSAGIYVTAAAHVAAMAPVTYIGTADPGASGYEPIPEAPDFGQVGTARQLLSDIAMERGRNADALRQSVLSDRPYLGSEALENNIIDLIAKDVGALLAELNGRTVELEHRTMVLHTEGLEIREIKQTPVERFLGLIANPNVAFVLLFVGILGLAIEWFVQGSLMFAPGISGVICLALAYVALSDLPVSWLGLVFVVLSVFLFWGESMLPGLTYFGVSGAVSFVLGGFLLFGGFGTPSVGPPDFDAPSVRVNVWLLLGTAAVLFGALAFLVRDFLAARRVGTTLPTTYLSLVGQTAVATTELAPRGTVHLAGEYWNAVSDTGETLPEGLNVLVVGREGLVVRVSSAARGQNGRQRREGKR